MPSDDPDIDIINARKLRELREKAVAMEKAKVNQQQHPRLKQLLQELPDSFWPVK
jgi:hypothetical protein